MSSTTAQPSPTTSAPAPALAPTADALTAELALLQRARQALRDGQPTVALDRLADHARRFPRGQLTDERRATRIEALCAAGQLVQAAREAQQQGRDPVGACP